MSESTICQVKMESESTSYSTSWYGTCKYRLPCGYCELKKQDCNWMQPITKTWNPDRAWYNETPYTEVTCKGDEEE